MFLKWDIFFYIFIYIFHYKIFFFHIKTFFSVKNEYFVKNTNIKTKKNLFFNLLCNNHSQRGKFWHCNTPCFTALAVDWNCQKLMGYCDSLESLKKDSSISLPCFLARLIISRYCLANHSGVVNQICSSFTNRFP